MTDDMCTLFENRDWLVTAEGLEHKANGYFIARDRLDDRFADGGHAWPRHLEEKLWCEPSTFGEAFAAARVRFGLDAPHAAIRLPAAGRDAPSPAADAEADRAHRLGALAVAELQRLPAVPNGRRGALESPIAGRRARAPRDAGASIPGWVRAAADALRSAPSWTARRPAAAK